MFALAFLIGIYSYIFFALGIFHLLFKSLIIIVTLLFLISIYFVERKNIKRIINTKQTFRFRKISLLTTILVTTIVFQLGINVIGVISPELAFDALWYHLTLPKLYLENHSVYFIPGGLLYYSAMPKLGEMLYIPALAFGNEITAKSIQFIFSVLILYSLYKMSRLYFSKNMSLLAVVVLNANLVFAWESTTAYVDLIRTFFEVLALWSLLLWDTNKKRVYLLYSAMLIGLAITTKVLAISSLLSLLIIVIFLDLKKSFVGIKNLFNDIFSYLVLSMLVPLPWFIFSFMNTGNPFYPFFTEKYPIYAEHFSIKGILYNYWVVLTQAADPLSPIYLILLPLIFIYFSKFPKSIKIIILYSISSIILWYFTPRTGGGRFILPYIPAFTLLSIAVLNQLIIDRKRLLVNYIIVLMVLISFITIFYRGLAERKYVSYLSGKESKHEFLSTNLHFHFGDFIDTDRYFEKNIKSTDRVLLIGFHNLYYVQFPFIHESWLLPSDKYNFIAVQNRPLPIQYKNWRLVHTNNLTLVKVYKRSN